MEDAHPSGSSTIQARLSDLCVGHGIRAATLEADVPWYVSLAHGGSMWYSLRKPRTPFQDHVKYAVVGPEPSKRAKRKSPLRNLWLVNNRPNLMQTLEMMMSLGATGPEEDREESWRLHLSSGSCF